MARKKLQTKENQSSKQRVTASIPVTDEDEVILKRLTARYQEAVVSRNRETGEFTNANVLTTELLRAGLLSLDDKSAERLRSLVETVRKRKGRPRINDA